MLAYEFYLNDGNGDHSPIAILPERRKDKRRVTRRAIMRWGRLVAGSYVDPDAIYFIRIEE